MPACHSGHEIVPGPVRLKTISSSLPAQRRYSARSRKITSAHSWFLRSSMSMTAPTYRESEYQIVLPLTDTTGASGGRSGR